jgi:hypothetical protein
MELILVRVLVCGTRLNSKSAPMRPDYRKLLFNSAQERNKVHVHGQQLYRTWWCAGRF